jgi:hypothetical protein
LAHSFAYHNCHQTIADDKEAQKTARLCSESNQAPHPGQPEKAQIEVHDAEDLYREIRVENVLTDDEGKCDQLLPGEEVDVTLEAETHSPKKRSD